MGAQAPQWLFTAFVEAMTQIGATAPAPTLYAEARDLVSRWNEPGRHLHNSQHLINVLAHIDELSLVAHDPDILRIAFWYHGAFLNRALEVRIIGADPELICRPCIDHTTERLTTLGVSDDVVSRIHELLHALVTHRASRSDSDAQVLIDSDCALLASPPQIYKKYRASLREEFSDLDDLTYWRARRRAICRLLSLDSIYRSPLGREWEDLARSNLEAEKTKLDSLIANQDPDNPAEDETDPADFAVALPVFEGELSETGTLIIRRRPLKKNACVTSSDEPTTTGTLPVIHPHENNRRSHDESEEDSASSLETAIDTMDIPPAPAE
ncbi:HD domain-containing protein [Schaalia sp. lx-100]|uniref:HD domain-containing protein n=1 Tax=Schaalia sp. lx-100 TaxID=2899081 RepID=UPI001E3BE0A6|nr:hypothetical protein [Schaalia sp. lx-100]MCD4557728.1 hypothetical protein [Schaalia sp. lx-100]